MAKRTSGIEELDTELLVRYAVSENEYADALEVVERFRNHRVAVNVFRNYYAELPEGREEMASDLRVVAEKQGAFIFALKTTTHQYLYVSSDNDVQYIGDYRQGISDEDILLHFGFENAASFLKKIEQSFHELEGLGQLEPELICVACGVAKGELHILGCPVEQCPWCDGQLNKCNCRFDQLGVEEIEDEEQLDRFEEILSIKGRIAYGPEQSPSYPTAGNDPGPGTKRS